MLISLTNSPGAAKHAGLFPAPVDAEFGSVYQLDFCLHDSGQRRSVALPLDRHQILSITFDVSYHWWFCYHNLSGPMEMSKKTYPNWAQRPGWTRWQLPSSSVELQVVWVMESAAERQQPPLARKSSAAAESFPTRPTSIMSQLSVLFVLLKTTSWGKSVGPLRRKLNAELEVDASWWMHCVNSVWSFIIFSCHWVIIWTKQATWRRHVLSVFYWVLQSTSSDFGWSFLGH